MVLLLTPEVAAPASSPAAPPPVPPPVCAVALLLSRLEKKPEVRVMVRPGPLFSG